MPKNMNFGKYAIINTFTYRFQNEPDWFWKIKPATAETEIEVGRLWNSEAEKTENGFTIKMPIVTLEIAVKEISLLFVETNIPDGDGNPIIPKDASPEIVERVLRKMPSAMVAEIWEAVAEACPGYGPKNRKMTIKFEEGEKK